MRAKSNGDERHLRNTRDDSAQPAGWETTVRTALKGAALEVLRAKHSGYSLYTGECGAILALLLFLGRNHSLAGYGVEKALHRLQQVEREFESSRVSLLEGPPGCLVAQAYAHALLGHQGDAREVSLRLGPLASAATRLPSSECEVLYGRCGFLGAILFARRVTGDPSLLANEALPLVSQVISAGIAAATEHRGWPLFYEWHEKSYLGAAHGVAGILMTLLQLPEELEQVPGACSAVRRTADKLLTLRFASGNLPSSAGSTEDRLVHWCHGAPGLVPLLLLLARRYPDSEYREAARATGDVVWDRGLLSTKGPGVCHGIPGNGYALLALYRETGDELWLRRAEHFAMASAELLSELMPHAQRPYSLFEGLAGAVCFWTDVLHASTAGGGATTGGSGGASEVRFPAYEMFP